MHEIAPGIYRWTAAHPEWRTTSEAIPSYALVCGKTLALVDPLLPAHDSAEHVEVDRVLSDLIEAAQHLEILITIPYHTRSAEELFHRYHTLLATRIWGHKNVTKRFADADTPLHEIIVGRAHASAASSVEVADGIATAFAIGSPRRVETPLYFPAHKALFFGDAIVNTEGTLRVWSWAPTKPGWHETRFLPTLMPLLDLEVENVLVTHGPPVIGGGSAALRAALEAPPTAY